VEISIEAHKSVEPWTVVVWSLSVARSCVKLFGESRRWIESGRPFSWLSL